MDAQFLQSAFKKDQYPPADRPEVAFAGKSNVGKSSLINTLVNRKRLARTSATPGRTQAINFFRFGTSLYLVDLPGYGFARVPLKVKESWRHMVESYLMNRETLKAVVVILDIRRDVGPGDMELIHWLHHYGIHPLIVLTKADKVSRQQARRRTDLIAGQLADICSDKPVVFSAKTRQGRDDIWKQVKALTGLSEQDSR